MRIDKDVCRIIVEIADKLVSNSRDQFKCEDDYYNEITRIANEDIALIEDSKGKGYSRCLDNRDKVHTSHAWYLLSDMATRDYHREEAIAGML